MPPAKPKTPPQMTPKAAANLIEHWHGLAIGEEAAKVAAADFNRINPLAETAADEQYGFWDNPSDLTRLLLQGDGS